MDPRFPTKNPISAAERGEEIWLPIEKYRTYEVSNLGRVRRVYSDCVERILRPAVKANYYRVPIGLDKQFVHRLVAEAFLGWRPRGYVVNHKDRNTLNNRLDNLEWATSAENTRHAVVTGYSVQVPSECRTVRVSTVDLERELFDWLESEKARAGASRNRLVNEAVRLLKSNRESTQRDKQEGSNSPKL